MASEHSCFYSFCPFGVSCSCPLRQEWNLNHHQLESSKLSELLELLVGKRALVALELRLLRWRKGPARSPSTPWKCFAEQFVYDVVIAGRLSMTKRNRCTILHTLYRAAILSRPLVVLYFVYHSAKSCLHLCLTFGSTRSDVPQTRSRSNRGSSTKVRWNLEPAFCMRPSKIVRARNCR